MTVTRLSLLALAAAFLVGCASQPSAPSGPPGKHLVYRDTNGAVIRQFDYPDDALCRKVEALAGRSARCQPDPVAGLGAKATLRYVPPGMLVQAHYVDMARCRTDTSSLSTGVELVSPCAAP